MRLYESLRKDRRSTRADWLVPILPVVVYNGEHRWTAPTRIGNLVRPGTPPDHGERQCPPTFTGDSYTVIDIGAYQDRALPPDNLMSLLIRTELMEGLQEAGRVLEDAWRQLAEPGLREVRTHFREWFRLTLLRQGMDWKALENEMTVTKLAATGEVRSVLDARVQARDAALKAEGHQAGREEGREEGLARERALLRRLAMQRFGAATAADLERYLATVREHDRLEAVGDWIVACASGPELLERVKAAG